MSTRSTRALALGALALTALVLGLLTLAANRLPTPEGATAPPDRFSAERAVTHLDVLAAEPRPTGSANHVRAREYLVTTLRDLGLDTRVHTSAAVNYLGTGELGGDARLAAPVHNVVARIPGSDTTRPVALVTHYDSTPFSPGANDAGVPVSVLLETARALLAGPELRNDVLLVLTDAEEFGLLGAKALVEDDDAGLPPDALVLNFEARGSAGPTLVFESGEDSAWLVDLLNEHTARPQASSLFAEAYRYLPNLTDFTVFRAAGHPGLNLAYLDGYTRYHGADDTADTVDPATVQHQGEYALGLTRVLGGTDLTDTPAGDSVHFTVLGRVVAYSDTVALTLAVTLTGVASVGLVLARRRGLVSLRRVAGGGLLAMLHPVLAAGIALALAGTIGARHPEFAHYGDTTRNTTALAAFVLLSLAVTASAAILASRWVDGRHQVLGATGVWTALALLTSVAVPGASYVFLWPALFAVVACAVVCRAPSPTPPAQATAAGVLILIPLVPIVLPLVALLSTALGVALVAVAVGMLAATSGLLTAPGRLVPPGWRWPAIAVTSAAAIATGAVAAVPPGTEPYRDGLAYFLDADTATAAWLAEEDGRPPTEPAVEPAPVDDLWPTWNVPARRGPAPAAELTAPQVTTSTTDDGRHRVTVSSTRGAEELVVAVTGASVEDYRVAGVEPGELSLYRDVPGGDPWELWLRVVPGQEVDVLLTLGAADTPGAVVHVADRSPGHGPARPPGDRSGRPPPAIGGTVFDEVTIVATTAPLT